jgi:uracil phosphoribosyltransferase
MHNQARTPLDIEYETKGIDPANVALVPILRSGLGMIDGIVHPALVFPLEFSPTLTNQSD